MKKWTKKLGFSLVAILGMLFATNQVVVLAAGYFTVQENVPLFTLTVSQTSTSEASLDKEPVLPEATTIEPEVYQTTPTTELDESQASTITSESLTEEALDSVFETFAN